MSDKHYAATMLVFFFVCFFFLGGEGIMLLPDAKGALWPIGSPINTESQLCLWKFFPLAGP